MLKLQIIIFLGISILFIFIRKELEKLPLDIQRKYRKKMILSGLICFIREYDIYIQPFINFSRT